jgi:ankyrin repeat protein
LRTPATIPSGYENAGSNLTDLPHIVPFDNVMQLLPFDRGKDILSQAVEGASQLVRDARGGLDFFQGVQNAKQDGRETFKRVKQLHKIGQDIEVALRRREHQLQGVDRHELRGEDVLWKNTKEHLERCHRILRLLRLELIGWDEENDPGVWKVTALRLKLATVQRQKLAKLHGRLDTGFQALQLNTQAINMYVDRVSNTPLLTMFSFVQVDTQERIGRMQADTSERIGQTQEKISTSTSDILNAIAKLNRQVSVLAKTMERGIKGRSMEGGLISPSRSDLSPVEEVSGISIPQITVDEAIAENEDIDPKDFPLLQETLTGARSVIESYDPQGESLSVMDPFHRSPSKGSVSDEESPGGLRADSGPIGNSTSPDWASSIYQDPHLPEPILNQLIEYHHDRARAEFESDRFATAESEIIQAIETGSNRESWHKVPFDRIGMQDLLAEIYRKQRKYEEALDIWIQLLPTQQIPGPPLTLENCRHYQLVADTYYQMWRTREDGAALLKARSFAQTCFNARFNMSEKDDNLISESAELLVRISDAIPDAASAAIYRRYVIAPQYNHELPSPSSPTSRWGSIGQSSSDQDLSPLQRASLSRDPDGAVGPGKDPTNELVEAIISHKITRVLALLNNKELDMDLERAYDDGLTPLMLAFYTSRSEPIIQALLEHKAKIYAEDKDGRTVLHRAAAAGDVDMLRLALSKNAAKEARDKDRLTPLLVAVSENHRDARACVQALLDAADDMAAKDKNDWTVVHFATHNSSKPERPRAPNAPQYALKLLTFLLSRSASVDTPAKNGDTPLCRAAELGHAPTVKVLLNAHANPNHANRRGRTPLYLAVNEKTVTKQHEDVVRALLDAGADASDERSLPARWKDFRHLKRASRGSASVSLGASSPVEGGQFGKVNRVDSTSTVGTSASSRSTFSRVLGMRRSNAH